MVEAEDPAKEYVLDLDNLGVFKTDSHLRDYRKHFEIRMSRFRDVLRRIVSTEGSVVNFAHSYKKYGLLPGEDGVHFREWLPGAKEVYLTGDFNGWHRTQHKATRDEYGNFNLFLPKTPAGEYPIPHGSKIKMHVLDANNKWKDVIPAWIRYAIQNDENKVFDGCFWNPPTAYKWRHPVPPKPTSLKIYECHIGMGGIDPRVHTFKEFTTVVLPRVKRLGYNCIQIMAIMEHSYYGSFGYHVTNFFAVSSRFGTPEDLKELIDEAHGMGLYVLMDLVHSHASSNANDGINLLDGTDYQYFHAGAKGNHELWDSKIFDYSKWEVQRFLLSNLAWYLEEYHFDGYRFDGITSMLYLHRGIGTGFTGGLHEYFTEWTDIDALVYLMLGNELIHTLRPDAITIAEDVSGMPSLGRTIKDGGLGFDYRLAMSIPDKWIKLLKEVKDDDWQMGDITFTLINRRYDENVIAYAESHDQALVGDKTLAMWLFDAEMYWNMSELKEETLIVHRGMSLHKMIRLITFGLGGDGYLNFMGNEFGHPEWIDFPREGNGWSYHHCRRRWDLAEDSILKYGKLEAFDAEMIALDNKYPFLNNKYNYVTLSNEGDKVIVFEREGLVFVFNFHPTKSFENYLIGTNFPSDHIIVLDTDEKRFGGQGRLEHGHHHPFPYKNEPFCNRNFSISVYIPSRTAMVLRPINHASK